MFYITQVRQHVARHLRRRSGSQAYQTPIVLTLTLALLLSFIPISQSTVAYAQGAEQPAGQPDDKEYRLYVSTTSGRGNAAPLEDQYIISGDAFIYLAVKLGQIRQVRYYLDHADSFLEDPAVAGTPLSVATSPPFLFTGFSHSRGTNDEQAFGFDTTHVSDGLHVLTAAIDLKNGQTQVLNTAFEVQNGGPAFAFRPGKLSFTVQSGETAARSVDLITSDASNTSFALDADVAWVTSDSEAGLATAPDTVELLFTAEGLEPGVYETTVAATAEGYKTATLPVKMVVTPNPGGSTAADDHEAHDAHAADQSYAFDSILRAASTCGPLTCGEILVDLPYELNFDQDHGGVVDGNNVGTGFTYVDPATNATGYLPQNLSTNASAPGTLSITTTSGIAYTTSNSQDNALAVGIDAPSQVSVLKTTLLTPSNGTGKFEQAGLWFGNDEENYVKLDVISSGQGTKIEYVMEVNGSKASSNATSVQNFGSASVTLTLRANPGDRSIAATYKVGTNAEVSLGQFTAPGEFFSFDAARIDPTIGTDSFGGIYATHRNATTPAVYIFDNFSVTADAAPPPPTGYDFVRSSFSVPMPTSMTWGPDGRLYVTELFGKIHAITLNASKQVVADQVVTTLGARLTLGIAVDPASTSENVILWVSHADPATSSGGLNTGMVSRLSGPGFTVRDDVITGLPRSMADHAVNAIHFGPDGKLYIAVGGNTAAGAPNNAVNSAFGTRAEQPLGAALIVADVNAPGFDGSCETPENTYAPAPCDVVPYATGVRNMYDFVFHSNGSIYGPDNGLGVTGTYPQQTSAPCEGFGDTRLWTNGGNNPGEQPDILLRLEQGKYYGHPNPYRNECVYKDGSYQRVSPLSNYTPAMANLGLHRSVNGTIEYTANAFGGALQGQLLITSYSVGDDIMRVKLSADGRSVVEMTPLVGGFNDPLPLLQGPDGTLYVGELNGNKITVLQPGTSAPSDTTPPSAPNGLTATGSTNGVSLDWADNTESDLAGYHVYRSTTENGDYTKLTSEPVAASAYNDTTAPAEVTHYYYVTAADVNGNASGPSTKANAARISGTTYTLAVSMNADRSDPATLGGQTFSGNIYVYVTPEQGVSRVRFYLDDPNRTSSPRLTETKAPWDFAGGSVTTALPFDTSTVANGSHIITAALQMSDGSTQVLHGSFMTDNEVTTAPPESNLFQWTPSVPAPLARFEAQGAAANGKLYLFGGFINASLDTTARSDVFDPATNTWTQLPDMPVPLTHTAIAVDGDDIYLIGGYDGDHPGPSTTRVLKFDTTTNTWSDMPPLPAQRGAGGAAILNGQLHFFGGATRTAGTTNDKDFGDHWVLSLDGDTTWESLAPLPNPRNHLSAIALNGKIYALGGQYGHDEGTTAQDDVHVYNPATNTWQQVADIPLARGHITYSTFNMDGRIVIIGGSVTDGGHGKAVADSYAYDPETNIWLKLPSIPAPRKTPIADIIGDKIIVTTGNPGGSTATSTTWIGSFPNKWETATSMPVGLGEVAAGIIGNTLYVIGEGNASTLAYNLSTGTWSPAATLAQRQFVGHHHGAEVVNGKLYVIGGLGSGAGKVQIFNPATNTWTLGADMPFAAGSSATAIINGDIYVAGGIVGTSTTTQAAKYDPDTNTWTTIAPMPQGRNHAASATDGDKLYVFGGRGPGSGDSNVVANGFNTVQIYDPATNSWVSSDDPGSTLAPLPQARGGMGKAVYFGGEFYVIGGETKDGPGANPHDVYDRVDVYNPDTNTWRLPSAMPTARHGIFPLLINSRIYVAGGGTQAGHSSSSVLEIYNPGIADASAPAAPTGLSATGSASGISLNWADNTEPDLSGYHVYRSASQNGTYSRITSSRVTSSAYTDTTAPSATTFYYYVTALDTSGNESGPSNTANASRPADTTPPAAPANLTATGTTIAINLNWNDNSEPDLAGYQVYRSNSASGPWSALTTSPVVASAYSDTTAVIGTTYHYRVTAVDVDENESSPSNTVSATRSTDTTPPAAPTGLVATGSVSGISLDWNNNAESDLAGYHVYRSDSAAGPFNRITTNPLASSNYADTAAPVGSASYYYVTAIDASSNESGQSSVANATRPSSTFSVVFSINSNRSSPTGLDGQSVSGNIFAFVSPTSGISQVRFYLDDPDMAGSPRRIDTSAPFDFNGGTSNKATAWNTASVPEGDHVITAAIDLPGGTTTVVNATFVVDNVPDAFTLPAMIQFEDYNAGGEGVGYHDTTTGNSGGKYRSNDVDIQTCSDPTTPAGQTCYNVGWTDAGEWLAYTITVPEDGSYGFALRVATPNNGRTLQLQLDGADLGAPVAVPNTGGYQTWETVTAVRNLPAGEHELRVVTSASGMNLNYVNVTTGSADNLPPTVTVVAPANGATVTGTAIVGVSAIDDTDPVGTLTVEVRIDNGGWAAATWNAGANRYEFSWDTTTVANGARTIDARATDSVGESGTSEAISVTVNNVSGPAVVLPATIQAEDYIGYHDMTSGNTGGVYRNDDVDIQPTTDTGGGFNVGWTRPGEWLSYEVTVPADGQYTFSFRLASPHTGKRLRAELNGINVTGPVTIPNTGGWQTWQDVTTAPIQLTEGTYTLRIVMETDGFNFNHFTVAAVTP